MSAGPPVIGPRARLWCVAAAVAGIGALAGGMVFQPKAAFAALLVAAFFYLTLAAGAVVFLAIVNVSKAGWHTSFKRVPEAMAACLPLAALAIVIALAGLTALVDRDPASHVAAYLAPSFLLGRAAAVLLLWTVFAALLRRNSLRQDADGDVRHTARNVVLSAAFLVVFLFTFSMASIDWLMSLTEHWASSIFGLYNIAGLLSGSVAIMAVAVVWLRHSGRLAATNGDDLHDLGKLLFSFVTLWAYLWFSQYLLIWYTNFPEETSFYLTTQAGTGGSLLLWANVVVNWLVPFFLLLPRDAKRSSTLLVRTSLLVLAGRWLDTHLMVVPAVGSGLAATMALEVAAMAGLGAAFVLLAARLLAGASLVPKGDPYLVEVIPAVDAGH